MCSVCDFLLALYTEDELGSELQNGMTTYHAVLGKANVGKGESSQRRYWYVERVKCTTVRN